MRAAGYVLVGGRSSRMGLNKARLPVDSHLVLVESVANKVANIAGNVALIGDPAAYIDLAFECIPDLRRGLGPLAGIEAALALERGQLNVIVACDMPGLKSEWLARLLAAADASDRLCFAAEDLSGRVHPLCAVYRAGCLPVVRRALDSGHLRLLEVIDILQSEIVKLDDIIDNVNTPDEWNSWLARQAATISPAPLAL
jgi:molybdopterin-guanine dinucleotide biosynthesis protein A